MAKRIIIAIIVLYHAATVLCISPELRAVLVDTAQLATGMPQQVHLALTKKNTEMSATWVTFEDVPQQLQVRKTGTSELTTFEAETTTFVNPSNWTRYVHRATMTDLNPGDSYAYQVGRPGYLSKEFVFKQPPLEPPYNILVFGDLGVYNGESIPSLLRDAAQKKYDLIVNLGDIAYDMFKQNGTIGDQYFATLEPLFATVPYMVVAGNHEAEQPHNYTTYVNSFTMPDESYGDNQFYSFDFGPIHFVALSSEYYGYFWIYGRHPVHTQYDWLVNDLEEANKNRAARPWIISYFHRPFYCSNEDSADCRLPDNTLIRDGSERLSMPGLESLFLQESVDMAFWGHEHSYERFFPRTPTYKDSDDPYANPGGPIYIVSGSAGCHAKNDFAKRPAEYSAVRSLDWGYSRMFVPNSTHILFEQFSAEQQKVIDSIWISKDPNHRYVQEQLGEGTVVCHPRDAHCRRSTSNTSPNTDL